MATPFNNYEWRNTLSERVQTTSGMNHIQLTAIGIRVGLYDEREFAPRSTAEARRMGEILIQSFALKKNPSLEEAFEISQNLSRLGLPNPMTVAPLPIPPYGHLTESYPQSMTLKIDRYLLEIGTSQLSLVLLTEQLRLFKEQQQLGPRQISESHLSMKINDLIANIENLRVQVAQLRKSLDSYIIKSR